MIDTEHNSAEGPVLYAFALAIGIIAGLRTMTAPAAVAWASQWGALDLDGSWLHFFAHPWTAWILTVLALGEFVTDQLPSTPARTVPMQFGARLVSGGICGAALGYAGGSLWSGLGAGVLGAIAGTLGGRDFRARLAASLRRDRPAGFIEDAVAIAGAALILLAAAQ